MRLCEVRIYPVKGGRGISVAAADVEARGLIGDRRWVVVDATGRCVTQRELPALARLSAERRGRALNLSLDGEAMAVEEPAAGAEGAAVTVWDDTMQLREAAAAGQWLSRLLGASLRLFHQPDGVRRAVGAWGKPGDEVSLADAFPLLVATTASLAAVERAAGVPLGMHRFRPNLVVEGAEAWAEDGWAKLRVGEVELDLVKPCARCTVPTVDQETGTVSGEEPVATLRRIRMSGDRRVAGVLFGWNAVARILGRLRVGDPVTVTEVREPWPVRALAAGAPGSSGRAARARG